MIDQEGFGRCDQCNGYLDEEIEELILSDRSCTVTWHFCSWGCLSLYSSAVSELILCIDKNSREVRSMHFLPNRCSKDK